MQEKFAFILISEGPFTIWVSLDCNRVSDFLYFPLPPNLSASTLPSLPTPPTDTKDLFTKGGSSSSSLHPHQLSLITMNYIEWAI
jgi:hypothetical protein